MRSFASTLSSPTPLCAPLQHILESRARPTRSVQNIRAPLQTTGRSLWRQGTRSGRSGIRMGGCLLLKVLQWGRKEHKGRLSRGEEHKRRKGAGSSVALSEIGVAMIASRRLCCTWRFRDNKGSFLFQLPLQRPAQLPRHACSKHGDVVTSSKGRKSTPGGTECETQPNRRKAHEIAIGQPEPLKAKRRAGRERGRGGGFNCSQQGSGTTKDTRKEDCGTALERRQIRLQLRRSNPCQEPAFALLWLAWIR